MRLTNANDDDILRCQIVGNGFEVGKLAEFWFIFVNTFSHAVIDFAVVS